jgi:hypothetical protein
VRLLPGVSPVAGVRYFVTGILATLRDDPQSLRVRPIAAIKHWQTKHERKSKIQNEPTKSCGAQFRPIQKQRAHY